MTLGSIENGIYVTVCHTLLVAAHSSTSAITLKGTSNDYDSNPLRLLGTFSTSGYTVAPASAQATGTSLAYGYQSALVVMWESADLDKFRPKSAPLLTTASSTTIRSSSATATSHTSPATSSASSQNHNSLSGGAQAGIGVGVAILALCLLFGAWLLFRRRTRRRKGDGQPYVDLKPELPGDEANQRSTELSELQHPGSSKMTGRKSPVEIGANERHELEGGFEGHEAETPVNRISEKR